MLRYCLKRAQNASHQLVKYPYRSESDASIRSKKQQNVWDDPWGAALPKEVTSGQKAIEVTVDWKYVERLMPVRVIPEVPKHSCYPTPSGWRPPKPLPELPFYVERKRDHLLPLYLETRRDQLNEKTLEFEYVELVIVRNIHGDIFECERRMRSWLEERLQHPIATHIDELKGLIRIKGADRALVELCLYDFGF